MDNEQIRTFKECQNEFYYYLIDGELEKARKTIFFMEKNFPDKSTEISEMIRDLEQLIFRG